MRYRKTKIVISVLFFMASIAQGIETPSFRVPHRIIPLEPSLAELAIRIATPISDIVGVTAYTDYPSVLKSKPSIGPFSKPNLEAIIALKPDLVLASRDGTPEELVLRLRKMGVSVVTVATESIAALRESYSIVGAALGRSNESKNALLEFDQAIEKVRIGAKARPKRKVLLQVGEDPLIVAAGKTYLSEGLGIIGAVNVYPEMSRTYPRVSVEDVVRKNPDIIILMGMGDDRAAFERAEKRWSSFPSIEAVKRKRVLHLRSDALLRPGPRFPEGLLDLERVVYAGDRADP